MANTLVKKIVGRLLERDYSKSANFACECGDPGCPVHKGSEKCSAKPTQRLYRIDMEDETGTDMCDGCAEDAMDSGVFSDEHS